MNAYHVLATSQKKEVTGLCDSPQQTHFFVKANSPSLAIALVELRTNVPDPEVEDYDFKYTVKEAEDRGSSGMSEGEEIYSL